MMPSENKDAAHADEAHRTPTKRGSKPEFDEFLISLRHAVTEPTRPSQKLSAVLRLLKKGFKVEKEITSTHIDAIVDVFTSYGDITALLLRLFADYPKAGKQLAIFVRNRLSVPFSTSKGFPTERRTDDDRLFDLRQWIQAGNAERGPSDERYPGDWLLHAFICLANEPDATVRCHSINSLLRTVEQSRKTARESDKDRAHDYVKAVASLLLTGRVKQLLDLRALLYPELLTQEELRLARRESDGARMEANDRATKAETAVASLNAELQTAIIRIAALEAEVARATKHLEDSIVAATQREEHLVHEWQQRLSGQRHSVSKHMLHDIEEAIICLDRKEPNVDMALSRIRNAEKVIRDLE
jgi:hypothetical protein